MGAYKKYICAFADTGCQKSLDRFKNQAKQMRIYDDIYLYSEKKLDKQFYNHFQDKFKLRGFGYWSWKPQIILQTLDKVNEGDIVQYTDIGCHLNPKGIERANEYFEITNKSEMGILAFYMDGYTEKQYTKGDLFDYFGVRNNENIYSRQICATVLFVKKCEQSIKMIKQWLKVFYDDFSLIDDTPSKRGNFPEFIENRHDQSVWSILVKLNNVSCISHSEQSEFKPQFPIWSKRDIKRDFVSALRMFGFKGYVKYILRRLYLLKMYILNYRIDKKRG